MRLAPRAAVLSTVRTVLAASALALGVGLAHAQVRPEVGKPLQEAANLLKANRAKEALVKVRDADAAPNKTPAEQLTIERMRGAVAARAGDSATAIKAFEAVFAGSRAGSPEQTQAAEQLAFLYSQTRDWTRTREWANRARQLGGNAADLDKLLAFVNAQSGDFALIAKDAQAAIEAAEKAGRKPEEADLLRLADALRRSGNPAGQAAVLEKLVTLYPKREYWAIVLGRIQSRPGFSQRLALDVLRLKRETKTLDTAAEYSEFAQLALLEQQAAEAKQVLDEGFAAGVLGKGAEAERQRRLLALAHQRAADAPKALAEAEKEAAADKDGNNLVRIGFAYGALGQHDKGIALMQQGIARGGLRRKDDTTLHLGIALHRAGQKQRAAQVFRSVGGTDGTADLARLCGSGCHGRSRRHACARAPAPAHRCTGRRLLRLLSGSSLGAFRHDAVRKRLRASLAPGPGHRHAAVLVVSLVRPEGGTNEAFTHVGGPGRLPACFRCARSAHGRLDIRTPGDLHGCRPERRARTHLAGPASPHRNAGEAPTRRRRSTVAGDPRRRSRRAPGNDAERTPGPARDARRGHAADVGEVCARSRRNPHGR